MRLYLCCFTFLYDPVFASDSSESHWNSQIPDFGKLEVRYITQTQPAWDLKGGNRREKCDTHQGKKVHVTFLYVTF